MVKYSDSTLYDVYDFEEAASVSDRTRNTISWIFMLSLHSERYNKEKVNIVRALVEHGKMYWNVSKYREW